MRVKPDGSLDLDWRDPPPKTLEDYEQMTEQVIQDLLRAHPTLTREEAERSLEGFL
jgi:hypothetical protein